MRIRRISLGLCGALVFAPILSAFVAAQDGGQWQRRVQRQFAALTLAWNREHKLEPSHEPYVGRLRVDRAEDVRYDLDAGANYVFVGTCGDDCSGLQLRLYDSYGHLLDTDRAHAGPSVVGTSVARSGTFYLRINTQGCRVNSSWAGVAVYK